MAEIVPKVKKKITSFLLGEEGKISKESLLKTGAVLGTIALGSVAASRGASAALSHVNNIVSGFDSATITVAGTHTHHGSHASHASHGSHNSCTHASS